MDIIYIIYDLVFIFAFFLYLPIYILRKKINSKALSEKCGFIGSLGIRNCIWIHVVSVGEAILIEALVKKIREIFDYPILISTTTLTGNKIARSKYSSYAKVIFFPFDLTVVLSRLIKKVRPKLFIAIETEIWPNLFYRLKRHGIPIAIINGRISDKAFRRYKLIRPITRMVLGNCDYISVQNQFYKDRFISLGGKPDKIIIGGNLKFESIFVDSIRLENIKNQYMPIVKKDNLLIIAASTHHPEEEMIIDMYRDITDSFNHVSLLVAPRHIDRVPLIAKIATAKGFTPLRISSAKASANQNNTIYLLDTIGELLYFYSIADICFVGGSLANCGGHNILEPIYFLKPTFFGPSMENFKDIEEVVLEKGAGIRIKNIEELKEVTLGFLRDEALRNNFRVRCLKVFEEEKKGLNKNIEIILECLSKKQAKEQK